jgi:hypothetical protein
VVINNRASQRRWQPKTQVGFVAVAMIKKHFAKLKDQTSLPSAV